MVPSVEGVSRPSTKKIILLKRGPKISVDFVLSSKNKSKIKIIKIYTSERLLL